MTTLTNITSCNSPICSPINIRDMLTTTSTSLLNAWTELASLNFKDNGWDLIRMHSQYDSLILTIVSGGQEIGDNQKMIFLIKACETNPENLDWASHVRILHSSVTLNQITEPAALKDAAKGFFLTCKKFEQKNAN